MNSINSFIDAINAAMNYLVTGICLLFLLFIIVRSTIRRINRLEEAKQRGEEEHPVVKGLYYGLWMLIETSVLVLAIGFFPITMEKATGTPASVFRWLLLYLVIPLWLFFMTRKQSGIRGMVFPFVMLTVGLVGWLFDHWVGVLLISLPLYLIFGWLVYNVAQVIIPVSDPENSRERWSRFKALLWYFVGTQYPFWVATGNVSRDIENRIKGANSDRSYEPGTVWSYSHQVVGISTGVQFINVEGPGIVFTKSGQLPIALIDLRNQIRTAELDATTKDGVPIQVIINTSFKIDNEDWPKKGWKSEDRRQLSKDKETNPLVKEGLRIDRKIGAYPYSTARVKTVLSTTGINTTPPPEEKNVNVYWDEWALMQIQNAARQVISQRNLDQMWKPIGDDPAASALDEMATSILELIRQPLRRAGVQINETRIIDFSIDQNSPIAQRQINSWKSLWSQKITATLAEAEAIDKEEIEKAHAYAKSTILGGIAESIQKAHQENVDLPRHVIALYYIHAIEEYIRKQPETITDKEAKERIEAIKQSLLSN
jgi:hypothetical protein